MVSFYRFDSIQPLLFELSRIAEFLPSFRFIWAPYNIFHQLAFPRQVPASKTMVTVEIWHVGLKVESTTGLCTHCSSFDFLFALRNDIQVQT